jgi:hypothetical protein
MAQCVRRIALAVTVALVAGCATSTPPKESGFLGADYSRLHEESAPGGGERLVYRNPRYTPANYRAIWLEPITFYPEPQATDHVSGGTLDQIRDYADRQLRQKLGQEVRLVDAAGPGVARVRIAITAVGTETQALKAYQYIPIALVLTSAKAAIEGGRPQDASIAIETSVTDSVSKELLYAAVRGGTGEQVQNATQGQGQVQLDNLKPLIDSWVDGAATTITQYVASR